MSGWAKRFRRRSAETLSLVTPPAGGVTASLPPERWARFPHGGALFVHRPAITKGDTIRMSDMTIIDVPVGGTVLVLTAEEVLSHTEVVKP